ncbi:cytochrome c oxidase subunit II [Roseateles noduli]|nr:cytochrome c oxidase subunit II [Roseateles noduli]
MSAGGMLRPAGPQAEALAGVMNTTLIVCAFAFVFAMVCLAAALWWKGRRPVSTALWLWGGGLVLPVLVFGGLLLHGERQAYGLDDPSPPGAMRVAVTGHLWWWSMRYEAEPASSTARNAQGTSAAPDLPAFSTANELRVPVGRPVTLTLASDDVIHSYWVPALGGKVDMVPGRLNRLTFTASQPGVFRGPCSEYCGTQHAAMVLQVVAMPPDEFARWRQAQAAAAPEPVSRQALRGAALFRENGCASCHSVRSTGGGGDAGNAGVSGSARQDLADAPPLGPDLTHVASRLWLGAGALRNRDPLGDPRTALRQWIRDVQQVKPGARMPSYKHLSADEIDAIVEFLAGPPVAGGGSDRPLVAATPAGPEEKTP